jgi:hypothetical protein
MISGSVLPNDLWLSEYETHEGVCPFNEKVCLECEFAERLLLTGVPVDCRRGHMEKVKSLWEYMFKGYKK